MHGFKLYWTLKILASAITGCISISNFASLVGIPRGVTSSAVWYRINAITAGIKQYRPIIRKKRKHNKILLLAKAKLNTIELLISRALIDSYISHDELFSVNNVLRECDDMKEKNKKLESSTVHQRS